MDVVSMRPGPNEYVPCWNPSHLFFEPSRSFVSRLPNKPQDQNGNHHDAEHRTEQDHCCQKFANPVESSGTKS
jgi:hypothetical protein